MKEIIKGNGQELQKVFATLDLVEKNKTGLPLLNNYLVTVNDGNYGNSDLELRAFDLQHEIKISIANENNFASKEILLIRRHEINKVLSTKTMSSNNLVFSIEDNNLEIATKSGNTKAKLHVKHEVENEFPRYDMTIYKQCDTFFHLKPKDLGYIDILEKHNSKHYLNTILGCVNIAKHEDNLVMAATDGDRLVTCNLEHAICSHEFKELNLKLQTLKLLKKIDKILDLQFIDVLEFANHMQINFRFAFGSGSITCEKFVGIFPRYKELIPTEFIGESTFARKHLIENLKEIKPFVNEITNLITFANDKIASLNRDIAYEIKLGCPKNVNYNFLLNLNFLLDTANSFDTDTIVLKYNGPLNPLVFSAQDSNVQSLVMPIENTTASYLGV